MCDEADAKPMTETEMRWAQESQRRHWRLECVRLAIEAGARVSAGNLIETAEKIHSFSSQVAE